MSVIPDEICARCGKVITRRAIANVVGDEIVCTPCKRLMQPDFNSTRRATKGQLDFLERLGFRNFDDWLFVKASETIDRAQNVRYFAFQVARQEWRKDLYGMDLGLLVQWAFGDPAMVDEIREIMRAVDDAKYERQHELQEQGKTDVSLADCAPDLAKTRTYYRVRDALRRMVGVKGGLSDSMISRIYDAFSQS